VSRALDIIEQLESRGRNVPNYKFGPGFTAQGYYQITNPTWRDHAQSAGVDLSQYPTAMSAPRDVQRAVADKIFQKRGFQPWVATKHLIGQEAAYREPSTGMLASRGPMTMPAGTTGVPTPPPRPTEAAPAAQAARVATIQELEKRLIEKYPELRVTSRDRDPAHNAAVGGAKNSQHTHGTAMDVSFKGIEEARQREIVEYARTLGARGLGYYPKSQSAHFDVRQGAPAAWGQNYSKSSLPGTPQWFQEQARLLTTPGAAPTQMATNSATNVASPAGVTSSTGQDTGITPLPSGPAVTPDPFAAVAAALEQKKTAQATQLAQAAAQPIQPPQAPPPAPEPNQPMAPPVDYASMILPRLRRGLLGGMDNGLLGVG